MRTGLLLLTFFLFTNVSLSAQDGQYADVNGIKMYYEAYGDEDAEPVLLLHYWTNSSQLWKRHIPELEQHFRLIVPDLRGHGKSPANLKDFVMRQSAEDILALMGHHQAPRQWDSANGNN
ncbi:MAG: alpha/beta fold hydrolase [Bacteroidota bacterium]